MSLVKDCDKQALTTNSSSSEPQLISEKIIENANCYLEGRWAKQQLNRYRNFLVEFKAAFEDTKQRRTHKMFKMMSSYIGTRSPNQCRSHHQKMQRMNPGIGQIIAYLNGSLDKKPRKRREELKKQCSQISTRQSTCQKTFIQNQHISQDIYSLADSPVLSIDPIEGSIEHTDNIHHIRVDDFLRFDYQLAYNDDQYE